MTLVDWLRDSDASVRWQVTLDLAGAPAEEVVAEARDVTRFRETLHRRRFRDGGRSRR